MSPSLAGRFFTPSVICFKIQAMKFKIQGLKIIILHQPNTFAWMIDISLIES